MRIVIRLMLWAGAVALAVLAYFAISLGPSLYRATVGLHRYETVPPELPAQLNETAILVFSKTNGFRDDPAVKASNQALSDIAARRAWSAVVTENGAVFNTEQLRRFKAVVWNNTSGDVLTLEQRAAFQAYIENGGGFVGIHGAGGDPKYAWQWYVTTLIGAQFIGHTLSPQFQQASIVIEDATHPATKGLESPWVRTDEWYSFEKDPRANGVHVLATLDEHTYSPVMALPVVMKPRDIRMGDHPIIWAHCVKNGRAFYSALGHSASTYSEQEHLKMLEGAIAWAAGLEGFTCVDGSETARSGNAPP